MLLMRSFVRPIVHYLRSIIRTKILAIQKQLGS